MGRKRIPEEEKKIPFTITIRKKYIAKLREYGSPARIIERLVEDYLRKKKNL